MVVSLVARTLIARVACVGVQVEFLSMLNGCSRSVSMPVSLLLYMGEGRLEYSCNNVMKHHLCFVVVFVVVHALRGRVAQHAFNTDFFIGSKAWT